MRAVMIHAPHDLRVEAYPEPLPAIGAEDVRIRMAAGGICGSDLHYYHHGGFGTVRVRHPMALGHEASGIIEAVGVSVRGVAVGHLVAVNPNAPCGVCSYCKAEQASQCENVIFNGSAMRMPHVHGLFRETVVVPAARAFVMGAGVSAAEAALCEPFAVALHAVARIGDLTGKSVLVTGCGPIGVLVIAAAKLAGAASIVATDLSEHALSMAARFGATTPLDLKAHPEALTPYGEQRGRIDVAFECSGNAQALAAAVAVTRPRGQLVLVGLGGEAPIPMNGIVTKELRLAGTFRFDREFAEAARLIGTRAVDLSAMISAQYPLTEARAAFEHASDKARATKVAILLS